MPEETAVPITVFVKPYVRKYVLKQLADPAQLYLNPRSLALWHNLERKLAGRKLVRVENSFDPDNDRPRTRMVLYVQRGRNGKADINYKQHRYLTGMLTKAYLNEMEDGVQWYMQNLNFGMRQAVNLFRKTYGVNEEDQSLESAERILRKRFKGKRSVGNQRMTKVAG